MSGKVRIVHNRLLGGWFIVRGSHDTPLGGRFDSKAEAQAHLAKRNEDTLAQARAFSRAVIAGMSGRGKRRVKLNAWGNWNGYEGTRKVYDFGTNEQAAQDWAKGGELPKFDPSVFRNKIGGDK